jgi:hypothetical protein
MYLDGLGDYNDFTAAPAGYDPQNPPYIDVSLPTASGGNMPYESLIAQGITAFRDVSIAQQQAQTAQAYAAKGLVPQGYARVMSSPQGAQVAQTRPGFSPFPGTTAGNTFDAGTLVMLAVALGAAYFILKG